MLNRIQEILRHYHLAPSRFADILEVPRSTVSHILSERNKPSLEFIQKVLDKFPELDTNWLLKGEGKMLGKEKDLFSDYEEKEEEPVRSNQKEKNLPYENFTYSGISQDESNHSILIDESSKPDNAEKPDNQRIVPPKKENSDQRKLIRIILVYDDNTFEQLIHS